MRTYEETIEALNSMIPEIHENAVAHGWWDGKRTQSEIYALIHSELSESLEEYREGNPDIDCMTCFAQREESGKVPNKPEGVVVELADTVIRIMDYLGMREWSFKLSCSFTTLNTQEDLSSLIVCSHMKLSEAFLGRDFKDEEIDELSSTVKWIFEFVENRGYDLVEIIRLKHAFNVTRPYKHGGKII